MVVARRVLAALYIVGGLLHLFAPDIFVLIVPPWVPWPRFVVLATGFCELAGAAGLLMPFTRRAAGTALAFYAVCVFPANVQHAIETLPDGPHHLGWWYHGPRLLLQPVVAWWALLAGGVVRWPFRRAALPAGAAE